MAGIRAPLSALFLAAVSLTSGMGCELITQVDRKQIDQGFGGGNGQGGGGIGGMGGSGGSGGSGGCAAAEDCPGTDTDCQARTCVEGTCGFEYAPSGTATSDQVQGDCLTSVCDGMGATSSENADDDILDDQNPCTEDTCSAGQPSNAPLATGSACSDGGVGKVCDGAGQCVECNGAADCASQVCMASQCVPATCADTVKNGSETDTDCGGADCAECVDGKMCAADADCLSGVCSGSICQVPTCSDQVKNGTETDLDCGGPACGPCGPGLDCGQDSDCAGGSCSGSTCLPTCTDQVKNANETDVDCGGPQCPVCGDGQTCAAGSDCVGEVCSAGVCQAAACSDMVQNGTETDVDCGGPACSGCGPGLACGGAPDCASLVCVGGVCSAATCSDAVKNGGESDIDCGGPNCVKCGDGYQCTSGGDCLNGVCGNGFCLEAACGDGVKNGSETDVDCGGSCIVCGILEACLIGADCVSGICTNGVCEVPTCSDGVKNGAESDVDCGGGACPYCPDSLACVSSADCGSGICTNNVCDPTVCGDGIKGAAEGCDDGNALAGDCCSATCQLELDCEVENNDSSVKSLVSATFPPTGLIKASITPIGDLDYLAITVTSIIDLQIEVFQGHTAGACASIDTQLYLFGADGQTQLAYDDDDGLGFCSLINPTADTGARQLAPGTYFVRANEYGSNSTIAAYSVLLTATATCGNGIKEGYEQCDDGNQDNNDSCSNICKIITTPEVEPNDTCATANGPFPVALAGNPFQSGAISPIADNDWFAFTIPATADVVFETFDAGGPGSCVTTDTEIQVFQSDCVTPLGPAQNIGGLVSCAKLNPVVDAQVRHIPAGTYFVRVNEYQNNATLAGYTLQATLTALCGNGVMEGFEECDGGATCDANCNRIPTCADGYVDAPEICDDGNLVGGDGCDATCSAVEPNYLCPPSGGPCITTCGDSMILGAEQCDDGNLMNGDLCDSACAIESPPTVEAEPNGTFADAEARSMDPTPILISGVSTTISGSNSPLADQDYYKVVLAADSVVHAEIFDSTGNNCPSGMTTTLTLFNAAQAQIAVDSTSGILSCSAFTGFVPAGTYYLRVEETGNNAVIAAYRLQVKIQTPVGSESEANDATTFADSLAGPSDVFVLGGHQQNLDADLYAVMVPPGRSIRAEIIEGSAAETCESNGIDSRLTLVSPAGVDLVTDDDAGRGFCSMIDGTGTTPLHVAAKNLAGGMYFLNVRASTTTSAQTGPAGQFDYRLVVWIR